MSLDDERALRAGDPSGMLEAVAGLPNQARVGYALGLEAVDLPSAEGVANVAFFGMGGSAVSGDVLRVLMADRLRIPVVVVRSPEPPEWVGPHTLVVASSYSGDTAETLAAFEEAVRRGARIVAVTSGGELGRRAGELAVGRVAVPGGSQPRAALGYLAFATLSALEAVGLLPPMAEDVGEAVAEMQVLADRLAPAVALGMNPAKQLALDIGDRIPVIWGAEGVGAVAAARWKTQMNENAKVPAWASALPELDHNEVVGWSERQGHGAIVIALRHEGEHPDVAARFPLSARIAEGSGATVREVWAQGRSALARLCTLVLTGDLTSTYVALEREVDPTPVEAIARLKEALAKA